MKRCGYCGRIVEGRVSLAGLGISLCDCGPEIIVRGQPESLFPCSPELPFIQWQRRLVDVPNGAAFVVEEQKA